MSAEDVEGVNVVGRVFSMEEGEHVYFLSPSSDKEYVAVVFGNGALRIMDPRTLETLGRVTPGKPYEDLPVTYVKWFPTVTEEDKRQQYKLISVSSAGAIFGWKWDGVEPLRYKKIEEKGNEISVVDISPTEEHFMTAGKDRIVRLYNASTFSLETELKKGVDDKGLSRPTHVSRVFAARFLTKTLAISAGWESPIQLWDLRTLRSERQILGTSGSTDCIEPIPETNMVLMTSKTGSKLRLLDVIRAQELERESERLNTQLTSNDNPVISRFSAETRTIWCACAAPNKLIGISFSTGEVIGSLPLPSHPLNLTLLDLDGLRIYVCCQDGFLVQAQPSF